MKYKIALISHQAFALLNFRKSLIELLLSSDYEVFAFAPDFNPDIIQELVALGAKPVQYKLSRTGLNPFTDLISTILLSQKLISLQVDVAFGFSIKPSTYGMIAAWIAGAPRRICMIEGLGHIFTQGPKRQSFFHRLLKVMVSLLYWVGLRCSNYVIFLNNDDLNYFVKQKLVSDQKTINIGGIGVDLSFWTQVPLPLRPLQFIFIGRLLKEKGIFEFIESIRIVKQKYKSVRFVVLGDIDQNPSSINRSQVYQWVSEGLIEWYGHVSIQKLLKDSSVFVLPSYREGVPRTTQEAMAMGRPIITTDVPGCRDTVIDGINGYLIAPFDVKALAESMIKLIESPELILQMGNESRKLAEARFDGKQKDLLILKIISNQVASG